MHVNDLPVELFLLIMKASMYEKALGEFGANPRAVRVAFDHQLAQVCRWWRSITLACPELWSVITCGKGLSRWNELCLSRCSDSPIDLIVPYGTTWMNSQVQECIHLALHHLTRVRRLDLHLEAYDNGAYEQFHGKANPDWNLVNEPFLRLVIDSLATQPMPWLEEVTLDFRADIYTIHTMFADPLLPENIISTRPRPELERVMLGNCVIRYPSIFYSSSVRYLELRDVRGWDNVDQMIQCLQATPFLEHLIIHDKECFLDHWETFDHSRSNLHPPRCVPLDHLVSLHIARVLPLAIAIFSYLRIPHTSHIGLIQPYEFDCEDVKEDDIARLQEALIGHFASATTTLNFDEILVDTTEYSSHIRAHSAFSGPDHLRALGDFTLDVSKHADEIDDLAGTVIAVFLALPVSAGATNRKGSELTHELYPALMEGFDRVVVG